MYFYSFSFEHQPPLLACEPSGVRKVNAAMEASLLSQLKVEARLCAEADFLNANKRLRNKSAFVSRQTQRHYARLLEVAVEKSEKERDNVKAFVELCSADCIALRGTATRLATAMTKPKKSSFERQLQDLNHFLVSNNESAGARGRR